MFRKFSLIILVFSLAMIMAGAVQGQTKAKTTTAVSDDATLEKEVISLFSKKCSTNNCHAGKYAAFSLNLEERKFKKALIDKSSLQVDSLKLVDTKESEKSYLLMKIKGDKKIINSRMPIAVPLSKKEIKNVEDWINSLKKLRQADAQK